MNDYLLILMVLAIFAGIYFVIRRVEQFLASNFQEEPPQYQRKVPSCMMLTENLSDEELIKTIRQFAAQHEHISIILRDTPPVSDLSHDVTGITD